VSAGDVIASSVAVVGFTSFAVARARARRHLPASRRIPAYRIAGDVDGRSRLLRVRGRRAR
jgi:hypothetical protein